MFESFCDKNFVSNDPHQWIKISALYFFFYDETKQRNLRRDRVLDFLLK